jgi:hypothetical protein
MSSAMPNNAALIHLQIIALERPGTFLIRNINLNDELP